MQGGLGQAQGLGQTHIQGMDSFTSSVSSDFEFWFAIQGSYITTLTMDGNIV